MRRWLLARWLRDHARIGIVLKAYRCFFSQQLSAYLSNKYWAAWLSWRISWRKQRAETFLLKFATDLFPGLTSRVFLFNANVLNHKEKLSVKTYGSNQVSYVLPVNGSLSWISHSFNRESERDASVNVLNSSDSCSCNSLLISPIFFWVKFNLVVKRPPIKRPVMKVPK